MIDRNLAEPLLIYVNDPHFLPAFKAYIQSKIILAQKDLSIASDMLTVGRAQGRVQELNKLLLMDVEVKNAE
jgi:hypothetical protein